MSQTRCIILATFLLGLCLGTSLAAAEKKYDPGASDNEIQIGNIMPYSGPLSAYALIGRSPPKTVEQARKLVESDEVLLIFQSLGMKASS